MEMMMNGQEILQHFGQRLRECLLPDYCEDVLRLPAPPSDLSHFGGATTYEGTPAAFPLPNHHPIFVIAPASTYTPKSRGPF